MTIVGVLAAIVSCLQAQAASSLVTVEAVTVRPQMPPPGADCLLSVTLKNSGAQTATNFRFQVTIDGQEEAVYKIEVFAVNVDAGTMGTIDLPSFRSPLAAHATFPVVVTLTEAQWAEVEREGQTIRVTVLGQIGGLPVSFRQTVRAAPALTRP